MALYSAVEKNGDKYTVQLAKREIELKDDLPYLEYFAAKNSVEKFMADEAIWGEDLTAYAGFAETVLKNIEEIKKGVCLI